MILEEILKIILFYLLVIVAHELGHILTYRYLTGEWPNIHLSWKEISISGDKLKNNKERGLFYGLGIVGGVAPFVLFLDAFEPWVFLVMFLSYLYGSKHDFTVLEAVRRAQNA